MDYYLVSCLTSRFLLQVPDFWNVFLVLQCHTRVLSFCFPSIEASISTHWLGFSQ